MTTSRIASNSVFDDGVDRLADEDRRVVDDAVVHSRWKVLLQPFHGLRARHWRPAGRWCRAAGRRRCRPPACCRAGCAASTGWPSSSARDVRQSRDLASRASRARRCCRTPIPRSAGPGVDRELKGGIRRRRRRAEHAGGDLDVLFADRRTTSLAVSWRDARRFGSSQTRMLYSPAPNT